MQNTLSCAKAEGLTTSQDPITPELLRSAAASIQRVLDGSTCLEDWISAFSRVFNLSGRAANSKGTPNTEMLDARREYNERLREWYQHLPRLQGWLIAERSRLESRLAHGAGLRAWLGLHSQTR